MNVEEYERLYRHEDTYWWFVARRELALRWTERRGTVLDVGCGAGAVARDLAACPPPPCVIACDLSPLALQLCRRRSVGNLLLGDLEKLPARDATADAVVALDVIEHVADDEAAMAAIARALRPGGRLVLSVPAFRVLWSGHDVALHHFRRYTRARVAQLARAHGLRVVKLSYAVFLLFPIVAIMRLLTRPFSRRPRAGLIWPGGIVNKALLGLMRMENAMLQHVNFPWGVSVFLVAEKPEAPREGQ